MFHIDVDRLTLPRRPQGVIFEHIFKNVSLILTIGKHIDMRYVGKNVEGNIKNSFYICIKFVERHPTYV